MSPPSSLFSSVSSSTAGPSPAKRRKLTGPASLRSWSSATSISSKSTLRPASSASSAATPLEDQEHAVARHASVARVLSVWESLEQRYARAMDDDDIVDLRSGKLVQDRGILKARNKPWHYGQLLQGAGDAEDKEDGATTEGSEGHLTTGNEEDEDEEEEEEEERRDPDQSLDELQLVGETNEDDEDDKDEDEQDGVATSEDELGEWDTVPAPPSASPSPNGSPNASRASSPSSALLSESRPTTPGTLSTFLHANFRPKLEKLAREREDSPLPPADDLEAFMAAEQSLKARTKPGYLEPETPSDDDEVVYLDYGTSQEDAARSDADERGDIEGHENSEDELDDWDTVPAPPGDEENPEEDAEDQGEELLAHYDPPTEPDSGSDSPSHPTEQPSRSPPKKSKKGPRQPHKLPPPDNLAAVQAKASQHADRTASSSSEGVGSSPTKSKSGSSSNSKTASKGQASSSSTMLTPTMNRLMRDCTKEIRRTPSRHLIPEVVIPVYRGKSASPTKKSQTAPSSPKKQTNANSHSSASKPRTVFPTLSSSDDDAPLMSLRMPKQSATRAKDSKPKYIEIFDTDEEDLPPRPEARRSSKDQSGSTSPTKPSRNQKTHSKSRDTPSPTKSGKGKGKERASAKKRKRESVEDVQVETHFVERLGSLGLQDSDDEIEQGNACRRATASWQRALSIERPVRHSTPPRSVSPIPDEIRNPYQVGSEHDELREYDQPVQPSPRVDPAPQTQPQPQQMVPLPLPQPPMPQLQQQPLSVPQRMQPSNYPDFYIPTGFPYMQMQVPMQMQMQVPMQMQMQMPMAMQMPVAPQFYYPSPASPAMFISTPQVPAPQPQLPQQQQGATPNAGQEAFLTQMLYTLNYLAHQNVANKTGDQQRNQQQPSTPTAAPTAQTDSQGFAIPLPPVTRQQAWRVPSTPVTSMPSRQAAYESDSVSHGRSILRVGGSRDRRSSLGLSLDPKGKGKEVAHSDFSDSGSEYESRRAMSVTFSDPPSVDTPKGRYAPMLSSPVAGKLQRFAAPRPSPLRKSSSNLDRESGADQQDGAWDSPSSSPTKRSGRQPLAPSNTMPSLDRRGSDTSAASSSAPLSNSSAVLAKARVALSSSLATTSSFTTTQSGRAGRR